MLCCIVVQVVWVVVVVDNESNYMELSLNWVLNLNIFVVEFVVVVVVVVVGVVFQFVLDIVVDKSFCFDCDLVEDIGWWVDLLVVFDIVDVEVVVL